MYWHELCMYKTMCILSLCDQCFALYISKCIQISCSTAVSLYYTAAPRSPSLTLPPPISPLSLNLTSKVFLGNSFLPSFNHDKLNSSFGFPLFKCFKFSVHHSFCKISTILLNISFQSPNLLCPWFILFQSYIFKCLITTPSTLSHMICAQSSAFNLIHHLNVQYT